MTEPTAPADPKYRVTMRSVSLAPDGSLIERERLDYVPLSILAAYVESVRPNWQSVTVSDEPDYGPGGEDGDTHIPAHLASGGAA
jgi:hypothetical protein